MAIVLFTSAGLHGQWKGNFRLNIGGLMDDDSLLLALDSLEAYLALYPGDTWGIVHKAEIFLKLGEYNKSVQYYRESSPVENNYTGFLDGYSFALFYSGNEEGGFTIANRALENGPSAAALAVRAHYYYKRSRYKEALEDYNVIIDSLEVTSPWIYGMRGMTKTFLDRHPEAVRDLDYALTASRNPSLYLARARSMLALGDHDNFRADFHTCLQIHSGFTDAFANMAELLIDAEEYLSARTVTDELLKLEPDNMQYLSLNSQAIYETDGPQAALIPLEIIRDVPLTEIPSDLLMNRLTYSGITGKFEEAIMDLDELIRREYRLKTTYYFRGVTRMMMGGEEELSCSDLVRAYELGESDAWRYITMVCGKRTVDRLKEKQ